MLEILNQKLGAQQQIFDEKVKNVSLTILGNLNWHIIKFEQMRHSIDLSLKTQLKIVDDGGFRSKLKSIKIEDMPKIKDNLEQMRLSIESKVMELIQSPKAK